MLDCFVMKKELFPPISPVSKNQAEQARIVMMIVSKSLPKKKDLAEHSGWYKVADLIDFHKKSTMKRWCKTEECEAAINDTVESCRSGKKSVKLLAGKIQAKRKNAYLMTE